MQSIVLELQHDALDDSVPVSTMLRKAMVIARKLKITELEAWAKAELNGYSNGDTAPEYRKVHGQVKSFNPYNGLWLPVVWRGEEPEGFSSRYSGQSIPELENLMRDTEESQMLQMPFSAEATATLMRIFSDMIRPPVLFVSSTALFGIISKVRTLIIDWTLKLEEENILGNNMTFTKKEIDNANNRREIIIQNFQGILGDVSNSSVSQNLQMQIQPGDFSSLKKALVEKDVADSDIKDLQAAVEADPTPTTPKFGQRVASWIGNMMQKAATGAWDIGMDVAGSVLTEALKKYYGM